MTLTSIEPPPLFPLSSALAVGSTVQSSFDIGREAVAASPNVPNSQSEGSKFLLLPEGADHNSPIFSGRAVTTRAVVNTTQDNHLPLPPEDFLGREVDMVSQSIDSSLVLGMRQVGPLGPTTCPGVGFRGSESCPCHTLSLYTLHLPPRGS